MIGTLYWEDSELSYSVEIIKYITEVEIIKYITEYDKYGGDEGMGAKGKRGKKNISAISPRPGPDDQAPQAGTGVSRFRRYRCSTVINYKSYFSVSGQFCFQLLFTT